MARVSYLCIATELCDLTLCSWLCKGGTPTGGGAPRRGDAIHPENSSGTDTAKMYSGQGASALMNPDTRTSTSNAIERIFFTLVEHMDSLQRLNAAHHNNLHAENVMLCADARDPADFMRCRVLLHDFKMCEGLVFHVAAPCHSDSDDDSAAGSVEKALCTMTVGYPRSFYNSATWSYDLYRLTCDLVDIFNSQNLMSYLRSEFCQLLFGIVAAQLTHIPKHYWSALYATEDQSNTPGIVQSYRLSPPPVFVRGSSARHGLISQPYPRDQVESSVLIHLHDRYKFHANIFQPFITSGVTPRDVVHKITMVGRNRANTLRMLKPCSWSPPRGGVLDAMDCIPVSTPSLQLRLERCADVYNRKTALFHTPVSPVDAADLDRGLMGGGSGGNSSSDTAYWISSALHESVLLKERVMASWRNTKESILIQKVVAETILAIADNFNIDDDCALRSSNAACTCNVPRPGLGNTTQCRRCSYAAIREGRARYLQLCMLQSILVVFYRWLTDEFHDGRIGVADPQSTSTNVAGKYSEVEWQRTSKSSWWQRLFSRQGPAACRGSSPYNDLDHHRRVTHGMLAAIMVVHRSDYHCMRLAQRLFATLCIMKFAKNVDYQKSELFKYRAVTTAEHVISQSPLLLRLRDSGLGRHAPVPCMGLAYRTIDSKEWFLTLCRFSGDIESYAEATPGHFAERCSGLSRYGAAENKKRQ